MLRWKGLDGCIFVAWLKQYVLITKENLQL